MKLQLITNFTSIFCDSTSKFIWESSNFILKESDYKAMKFYFFSQKKQQFVEKTLFKSNDIIFRKKKNNLVIQCNIENAILEKIENSLTLTGLRFTKNMQILEFFGDVDEWFEDCKIYCIQKNLQHYYLIENKIAEGSFAEVFKLVKINDKKEYALKRFNKESNSFDLNCLKKELKILRILDHQNIVKTFEVFESKQFIFIIQELLNFGNLDTVIEKTILTEDEILKIIYKLLNALCNIHSKGIIHRDIKPENIYLRKPSLEEIVISDFGLADFQNEQGLYQFHRCGTPGNIAPEVLQEKPYSYNVDVYALGLIFYQMLAKGKNPFIADDYEKTLALNEQGEINFSIISTSPQILQLLKQMLDSDPFMRCSAQEAKKSQIFKKFTRQTIIIKRKKLSNDLKPPTSLPRSTSQYQSPYHLSPKLTFRGQSPAQLSSPKHAVSSFHIHPIRLKSYDGKVAQSNTSSSSGKQIQKKNTLTVPTRFQRNNSQQSKMMLI